MATRRKKLKKRIAQMQEQADQAIEDSRKRFDEMESRLPTRTDLEGGLPTSSNIRDVEAFDPQMMAAQRLGLSQAQGAVPYMQQVAAQGFTPQDQAVLDSSLRQQNLNEQAQRGAILQQAQMRGAGGGGAAIAGALAAQQGAANRGADTAAQLGMSALNRRYAANQDVANLGAQNAGLAGQIDAQRFGQQTGRGSALDQFNMQLAGARGGAAQQQWGNQFGLAGAQSGANANAAGYYGQQAQQGQQQLQQMNQNIWGGVQGMIGSIAPMVGAFGGGSGGGTPPPQPGWGSGTYRGTPGGR